MQSFCEYYAGRYEEALRFAEAGLAEATADSQRIRLAVNGVARAKGKLGDADGVRRAVDQAYEVQSRSEAGISPRSSISLAGYSSAQLAANAATAYLSLARPREVERYGRIALGEMPAEQPWGRALVQLDMARSQVMSSDGDFDAATAMIGEVFACARGGFMTPVRCRGMEFVGEAAARRGDSPQLREIRTMLLDARAPGGRGE